MSAAAAVVVDTVDAASAEIGMPLTLSALFFLDAKGPRIPAAWRMRSRRMERRLL
jgi:hypothetical protein